jgi:hypothetical protein
VEIVVRIIGLWWPPHHLQAVFGIRLVQLLDDRNIGSGENNNTEVA